MTCIVGMVDPDGSVWVMGDSAASNSHGAVWVQRDLKVWRHGEMAIGMCGSFRGRDIMVSNFDPPVIAADGDPLRYLRTGFADTARKVMQDGGFLTAFKEGNDSTMTALLIGLRGRLFTMRNDFSIGEQDVPYAAIGSGAPEALGSLFSTRDWTNTYDRLVESMNASVFFNAGVRPPYNYVRTSPWPTPQSV